MSDLAFVLGWVGDHEELVVFLALILGATIVSTVETVVTARRSRERGRP